VEAENQALQSAPGFFSFDGQQSGSMEIELLKEAYVRVLYDQDRQLGKIVWSGSPTVVEYRKPFQCLLDWNAKGNKVSRFLSDTRNQGIVSPENRKWFEKEMVPAAVSGGLKRAAVLTNGNVFKQYYINLILSAVNKFNMPFKVFSSEESALEFLMKE
jgi:hypothetical protein